MGGAAVLLLLTNKLADKILDHGHHFAKETVADLANKNRAVLCLRKDRKRKHNKVTKGPSQKFAEAQWNEQNSFGRVGFLKKSHFRLQIVFCINIGLRVEAWSANFLFISGVGWEGFQLKLILFVSLGFCELSRWPLTVLTFFSKTLQQKDAVQAKTISRNWCHVMHMQPTWITAHNTNCSLQICCRV